MAAVTYLEAIRQGLWEEMERDSRVFVIGEDVGVYGGAFKVTEGFLQRFGTERVVDTPISEMAIASAAYGASLTGLRPVGEFQFMDFISSAHSQIVQILAKSNYRWGAPAPLVLARALGRRGERRPVPLAESGDVLRAHARTEGDLPGDRARCEGADQVGDPR